MELYTTLVTYRDIDTDTLSKDGIIQLDQEELVEGLQGLGISPIRAKTDGMKLLVDFAKSEVLEPYQKIQASLLGVAPAGARVDLTQKIKAKTTDGGEVELCLTDLLLYFYSRLLLSKQNWKGLLSMMRNQNPRRS